MDGPPRGPAWRLPALIIAAGALLALLALLLALWSKDLLKDVVRQGCARHANTVAGHVHAWLRHVEAEALRGATPRAVQARWRLSPAREVLERWPPDAPDPPPVLLERVAAHEGQQRLPLDLLGTPPLAATWLPASGDLILWDPAEIERSLTPLVSGVEADDRYGVALLRGEDVSGLDFRPRVATPIGPPLSAWRIAVGIEDPESVRDTLRFQTALLVALASWLLVVLVGGVLLWQRGQRQAGARQAQRERFLTRAYHELQTPLALLRAAAESIENGAVERPEDLARCVEIVRREEARLTGSIRRLLRVLRLQGRALDEDLAPAGAEVQAAAEEQRPSLAAQGLELELSLAPEAGTLRAPRDLLGDVVRELLANAAKYAQGGSRVRLSLARHGARLALEVHDDGPGFAAAPDARGSGLGLTLVEEAVLAAGGTLERGESAEGGAKLRVEVPCRT